MYSGECILHISLHLFSMYLFTYASPKFCYSGYHFGLFVWLPTLSVSSALRMTTPCLRATQRWHDTAPACVCVVDFFALVCSVIFFQSTVWPLYSYSCANNPKSTAVKLFEYLLLMECWRWCWNDKDTVCLSACSLLLFNQFCSYVC